MVLIAIGITASRFHASFDDCLRRCSGQEQGAFFEHPFLEPFCLAQGKFGWVHIPSRLLHAALGMLTSYHAAGMGAESRANIARFSFVIDYRAEPKLNPTIRKHL